MARWLLKKKQMTKQENDDDNLSCLHAYMIESGVKPEDFDTLPFGEENKPAMNTLPCKDLSGKTSHVWTHTREAATAHLGSVGLTFEGFSRWVRLYDIEYDRSNDTYPTRIVREYIRENHTLNDKKC